MIWVMGGNTYCLRYEAQRSGLEAVIRDLLENGMVYGGDSAGALLAGTSIAGIESADNPAFAEAAKTVHSLHPDQNIIELTDAQAVVFDGDSYHITEGSKVHL